MERFVKIFIEGETTDNLWSEIDSIDGIQLVERICTSSQAVAYYRVEASRFDRALERLMAYGEVSELDADEQKRLLVRYNTMQRIAAARM